MIKGIFFDLDGVLVSTQKLQVSTTLDAIKKYCEINESIKEIVAQTITTKEKLKILEYGKYLKKENLKRIYAIKKKNFNNKIKNKKIFNKNIFLLFQYLKKSKIKIALVTNANKITTMLILNKLKINKFFDIIVTNNTNVKPKPNAEPYKYAISFLKLKKENCLILEDSPVGILAAQRSGARYYRIKNVNEINIKNIKRLICKYS